MIKLYVDAASNGNAVGIGFVVYKDKAQYPISIKKEEKCDNHQAEFLAIIEALKWLQTKAWLDTLVIYSDSKVVVQALQRKSAKGEWQQVYLKAILPLLEVYPLVLVEWFNQSENHLPDQLAKRALRENKVIKRRMV